MIQGDHPSSRHCSNEPSRSQDVAGRLFHNPCTCTAPTGRHLLIWKQTVSSYCSITLVTWIHTALQDTQNPLHIRLPSIYIFYQPIPNVFHQAIWGHVSWVLLELTDSSIVTRLGLWSSLRHQRSPHPNPIVAGQKSAKFLRVEAYLLSHGYVVLMIRQERRFKPRPPLSFYGTLGVCLLCVNSLWPCGTWRHQTITWTNVDLS